MTVSSPSPAVSIMDIGVHRPVPSRTTTEEKLSLVASDTVYTYHCVCSFLLLATTTPLPSLPTRQNSVDHAHILPLAPAASSTPASQNNHCGMLMSTIVDPHAVTFQSDNGFEKRYVHRCGRCNTPIGYQLDWHLYGDTDADAVGRSGRRKDVVYLFPGGLLTSSEMVQGKMAERVDVSVKEMTSVAT